MEAMTYGYIKTNPHNKTFKAQDTFSNVHESG